MAEVRFTTRALADLRAQLDWLQARNPQAAQRLATDVARTTSLLSDLPLSGRSITGTTLRVMVTLRHRFRIVHRSSEAVVVVRVLHPSQAG